MEGVGATGPPKKTVLPMSLNYTINSTAFSYLLV